MSGASLLKSLTLCGLILCLFVSEGQAQRPDSILATRLQAVHRSGQTFLTWVDADTSRVKTYGILSHTEQITDDNLADADTVAFHIGPASTVDYISTAVYGDRRGFVITDLGEPLGPNQGLYVHTVTREEPAWYAVVSIDANGQVVSNIVVGKNSLETPVEESPGQIRPVLTRQLQTDTGNADVYTHWVDEHMHPREGMAYRFAVARSPTYRPEARHPLLVRLHGAGGRYGTMHLGGDDWVILYPDMRTVTFQSETAPDWNGNGSNFWYGLNSNFYNREDPFGGININYGERRVLWTIRWVMARYNIDPDRVHIEGGSMGGYATLSLALRHPELFASASAWVPNTDFHRMSDYANGITAAHWGPRDKNILTNEGIGIYDRADLAAFVRSRPEVDLPLIFTLNGKQDRLVGWEGPRRFYEAMQQTRHGLIAIWSLGGHAGPKGSRFGAPEVYKEISLRNLRRNQSYPAITFASTSDDPGKTPEDGDPAGQLNALFAWKDIVDRPDEYEITLEPLNNRSLEATADITPRRLQRFRIHPGSHYTYRNLSLPSGKTVQEATLQPDKHGLLTVKAFKIGSGGNRLIIRRIVK